MKKKSEVNALNQGEAVLTQKINFADQYELLRSQIMDGDFRQQGRKALGLAIILSRGVTAWVQVCHSLVPKKKDEFQNRTYEGVKIALPPGLRNEITVQFANMIMGTIQEART